MRIGIYGGSFNPIHIGHMHVADVAAEKMHLDHIYFCPAGNPYTKNPLDVASSKDRYRMTSAACAYDERFLPLGMEISREGPTYTIDTVRTLRKFYPNDELFFIMGTDAFNQLPTWKDYEALIKLITFVVIGRKNQKLRFPSQNEWDKVVVIQDEIDLDISSTQIRNAIKENKSFRYLVPNDVYNYILEHNLYR